MEQTLWKAWSSTQGAVALSSAEAEFYAMIDGAQKGKWMRTVAKEMGVQVKEGRLIPRLRRVSFKEEDRER